MLPNVDWSLTVRPLRSKLRAESQFTHVIEGSMIATSSEELM